MPGQPAIWLDGVPAAALPLPDRGLDFGDGLFETLLVRGDRPLYPELHLARLRRGCEALSFPDCSQAVLAQLQDAATAGAARGWHWSALRVTLTRGAGPRGYAPPEHATPRIIITASDLGADWLRCAPPAALSLASIRWSSQPLLAGLKHLNRIEQVLAAQEYRRGGFDEAVMLNQAGGVVSVTAGNLYLLRGGELVTAPLDDSGIAGTRRELILRHWAPALGLTVRIEPFSAGELEDADEVFFSNSLLGLRPVASFGRRNWNTHASCAALYRVYSGEIA